MFAILAALFNVRFCSRAMNDDGRRRSSGLIGAFLLLLSIVYCTVHMARNTHGLTDTHTQTHHTHDRYCCYQGSLVLSDWTEYNAKGEPNRNWAMHHIYISWFIRFNAFCLVNGAKKVVWYSFLFSYLVFVWMVRASVCVWRDIWLLGRLLLM